MSRLGGELAKRPREYFTQAMPRRVIRQQYYACHFIMYGTSLRFSFLNFLPSACCLVSPCHSAFLLFMFHTIFTSPPPAQTPHVSRGFSRGLPLSLLEHIRENGTTRNARKARHMTGDEREGKMPSAAACLCFSSSSSSQTRLLAAATILCHAFLLF